MKIRVCTLLICASVSFPPSTFGQSAPADTRHIARIDLDDVAKLPERLRHTVESELDPCSMDRENGRLKAVVFLEPEDIGRIAQTQVPIEDKGTLAAYVEHFAPLNTLNEKPIPSIQALVPSLESGGSIRSGPCENGATTLSPYASYHTWEEGVCFINNLANAYPQIAQVVSVGTSLEGRTIWALKISDNVTVDEPNEEKVLFMGETHAREWATHEMALYLAEYLVKRYATDSRVARIINNTMIWVVPVVNPDGYVHTWTSDRLWRKNKRNNGDGCWGVDINRNYNYRWGFDANGSSTSTCSETYRGPSAASEPETQALQNLMNQQKFAISVSYHTYSQLVLYPWGYTTYVTPESYTSMRAIGLKYAELAYGQTGFTYIPGQASYTIYITNGTSDDYAYGANGTLAFTPEMRPTTSSLGGFILPEAQIKPNCDENMAAALWMLDNVALKMNCSNSSSPTLIENPQLNHTSYFALPLTPTNQKPEYSMALPAAQYGRLEARQDDNLHSAAWVNHNSLEMEGCGTGSGYRFNATAAAALTWAQSVTSYKVLPNLLKDNAEIMISNRNVNGLNVIGIPSAVPVKMSRINIIKRVLAPPVGDYGTTEVIQEQRTALQDAASGSPWINWSWNWVDSSGVSHLSHPSGAGGADLYVRPFRSYQFTSNVQSWNFGSTSSAVYILQFPGYAYDCNENGIPDPTDIANLTSQDCDGDLIPDECQDCNGNGIGDACDISSGTSQDTNGNGVPDECDPDVTPPQPNPMSFQVAPSDAGSDALTMTAATATDLRSPPVQYFFDYVSGAGGHDSSWQTDTQYEDTGLMPNSVYNYRVKARDSAVPNPNETAYSATILGATAIETPLSVSFTNVLPNSLTATADGTFSNVGFGVTAFYLELNPPDGTGANTWTVDPVVDVSGLNPNTNYTFRFKARNVQGDETPFSPPASIIPGGCQLPGDVNSSGQVDGDDIAGFVRSKLNQSLIDDNAACADMGTNDLQGDIDAFVSILTQ